MIFANWILPSIRRKVFWYIDRCKGRPIRQAYNDIKDLYYSDSNSFVLLKKQKTAIEELIRHATDTTEFYKDLSGKIQLQEFPVINKHIVKGNSVKFTSKLYFNKKTYEMHTSGSTGTPFKVIQNNEKKKRVYAEVIFFSELSGYRVGNHLIFLRAMTKHSNKSKLKQIMQNESLIDISKLDDLHIGKVIDQIRNINKKNSLVLAYASTYDSIKDFYSRKNLSFQDKDNFCGIISSSETLFSETRELVSKIFNAQVFNRYSNQENGIIAQDCPGYEDHFVINESSYFIEILSLEKDIPVPEGEVGRIVVTDLYNYAMPLIRYDTGDIGSFGTVEINGIKKKVIKQLMGRKVDLIYDTSGNKLSPHIITNIFWRYSTLSQFQFIQRTERHYHIKLNSHSLFDEEELVSTLFGVLGANAEFSIEYVDEIPILSSGKRNYIINETVSG
ncbi:MAG: hypothetical protein WDA14_05875 [Sphaerochaetaceae bacterium]